MTCVCHICPEDSVSTKTVPVHSKHGQKTIGTNSGHQPTTSPTPQTAGHAEEWGYRLEPWNLCLNTPTSHGKEAGGSTSWVEDLARSDVAGKRGFDKGVYPETCYPGNQRDSLVCPSLSVQHNRLPGSSYVTSSDVDLSGLPAVAGENARTWSPRLSSVPLYILHACGTGPVINRQPPPIPTVLQTCVE